jgi:hypothetical protein
MIAVRVGCTCAGGSTDVRILLPVVKNLYHMQLKKKESVSHVGARRARKYACGPARPLEEEVGRNAVACDTGRGSLCSVSRRRDFSTGALRDAGGIGGGARARGRLLPSSDRRRRQWLARATFAKPGGLVRVWQLARPRTWLQAACLLAWSPDLDDLQAARHARGSRQDRDTTPARARSLAAHARARPAKLDQHHLPVVVVPCLRGRPSQARPFNSGPV